MFKKINDTTYAFNASGKTVNVEILNNGSIEVYEESDPGKTGFVLDSTKQFISLINNMADIAEVLMEEKEDED